MKFFPLAESNDADRLRRLCNDNDFREMEKRLRTVLLPRLYREAVAMNGQAWAAGRASIVQDLIDDLDQVRGHPKMGQLYRLEAHNG